MQNVYTEVAYKKATHIEDIKGKEISDLPTELIKLGKASADQINDLFSGGGDNTVLVRSRF